MEPLRDIRARLIKDHRDVIPGSNQCFVSSPDCIAVTLLAFDHEENFVHEARHAESRARLAQWRHVEDDVIEITRLQVWHEIEEFFQPELCRPIRSGAHGREIKIICRGSERSVRLQSRQKGGKGEGRSCPLSLQPQRFSSVVPTSVHAGTV